MVIESVINPVDKGAVRKEKRMLNQKQKVCRPKMTSVQEKLASKVEKCDVVGGISQTNAGISIHQLI